MSIAHTPLKIMDGGRSQAGIIFKDLLLSCFCCLALRFGLPPPLAGDQRAAGKPSVPRLSYCRSAQVAAPTVPSCPHRNSVRRQRAPSSTQQHSDLRPENLPQNCKILIGSHLWPPGVCVHVPGAPAGPRLLFGASVSHTVCPPNTQLCSENLRPAFKREMVQNSEVCFPLARGMPSSLLS